MIGSVCFLKLLLAIAMNIIRYLKVIVNKHLQCMCGKIFLKNHWVTRKSFNCFEGNHHQWLEDKCKGFNFLPKLIYKSNGITKKKQGIFLNLIVCLYTLFRK